MLSDPPDGLTPFAQAVSRSLLVVGFGQTPARRSDAGGVEYKDVRRRIASLPAAMLWPAFDRICGETGWYGFDCAWRLRGAADRLVGGVGLRRGRRDPERLRAGDELDF